MNLGDKTHSYDIGRTFLILIFNKCRDLSLFFDSQKLRVANGLIDFAQLLKYFVELVRILSITSMYIQTLREQSLLADFQQQKRAPNKSTGL